MRAEGTPRRARGCPRVTSVYEPGKRLIAFAGISAKPSDGLEPSTPSLPSSNEEGDAGTTGSRGHESRARRRKRPKTRDPSWTRVPALVFPQCSLGGWALAGEREPADSDSLRLEDDDGARFEFVGDCVEVREQ